MENIMVELENAESAVESTTESTESADKATAIAELLASAGIVIEEEQNDTEPAPAPEEEAKPEEDPKERRKQERDLAAKFRRLNRQAAEVEEKNKRAEEIIEKAKTKTLEFLADYGITLSDWVENQTETTEARALKEVENLRKQIAAEKAAEAQRQAEAEDARYFETLTNAVKYEFENISDEYSTLNALIQKGVFAENQIYSYIANDIQTEFEQSGKKPDIQAVFRKYEDAFSSMAEALVEAKKPKIGGVPNVKTKNTLVQIPTKPTTLSKTNVEAVGSTPEPKTQEEIEALIRQKYGF